MILCLFFYYNFEFAVCIVYDLCRRTQLFLSFTALCLYNWQCSKCNQSPQIPAPSHGRILMSPLMVCNNGEERGPPRLRMRLPALHITDSFHYFRLYFSHLLYIIWFLLSSGFLRVFLPLIICHSVPIFYHTCRNWLGFPEQHSCLVLKYYVLSTEILATISMFWFSLTLLQMSLLI